MNCLSVSINDLMHFIKMLCIRQCDFFWKHGKQFRQKHLYKCLQKTKEVEDNWRKKEILAIIQREKDRSFWCWLNYFMGKAQLGLVWKVLVEDSRQEGTLTEYITQKSVQQVIFDNIHKIRLQLSEAAPICSGQLQENFGYNTMIVTVRAILTGTYLYPPDFMLDCINTYLHTGATYTS
jgi:hypothetical protein